MRVDKIFYSSSFRKQLTALPKSVQILAIKKEKIFRSNPFHPSLRLHSLKGKLSGIFSISINMSYRVLFETIDANNILFISIGKHDIYRNL